ncbi:mannitol dehydrogenase family protein [Microbacterium invictum]|uniref:Mannitol-1-phosphate 5-dehydrogenase n=1 Tax=Microbacterium invictum TaxID=515415 RepID=A0AA40SLZ5_9MICO|nr:MULTISPECIES: mannitol dehydrogenase family protein [Microbacterium]MBB4138667.1 fructuronate reductase [Microbacterium invictum]
MPATEAAVKLTRAALQTRTGERAPAAPVRIVHIGLGAFARAHQAWYTTQVDDENAWGIAAFTGRSAAIADELAPQDGLFTLVERSADGDRTTLVRSIVEVVDGADVGRLMQLLAAPTTAVITMTVTESGYRLRSDGTPDTADPLVVADIAALRAVLNGAAADADAPPLTTALGRLVRALEARRQADAGPIAVVPCDNMPGNGAYVRRGVIALARGALPELGEWISQHVSFVSTSVDRITPRTTPDDVAAVATLTGWADSSPVVTEPFTDWVLSGRFPAGRPDWERAGARFVPDVEPYERRKLWLLNGAHSLLAYTGLLRGHRTVADAIGDDESRAEVERLWDEAVRHLPADLGLNRYRTALLKRFENARIEHHLAQIAPEALTKLRVRIAPVARAERAAGRAASATATPIAAWIALVLRRFELIDAQCDAITAASAAADPLRALLALVDEGLAADAVYLQAVRDVIPRLA